MIIDFKIFENEIKESIPDELAIWFMDFFA
jgi:hypothetical protein